MTDHLAIYSRVAGAAPRPPHPLEQHIEAIRTWIATQIDERAAEIDRHQANLLRERLDAYGAAHAGEPGCRAALRALEAQVRDEHLAVRAARLRERCGDLWLVVHRALETGSSALQTEAARPALNDSPPTGQTEVP